MKKDQGHTNPPILDSMGIRSGQPLFMLPCAPKYEKEKSTAFNIETLRRIAEVFEPIRERILAAEHHARTRRRDQAENNPQNRPPNSPACGQNNEVGGK